MEHDNYLNGKPITSPLDTLDTFSEVWQPLEDLGSDEEVFSQLLERPRVRGAVEKLLELLRGSIERRVVRHQPRRCKACVAVMAEQDWCSHPSVSVLLSGGVDSSLLALLVAQALPDQSIPLVNVAFQQVHLYKIPVQRILISFKGSGSYDVPDRLTGKDAVLVRETQESISVFLFHTQELNRLLPGRDLELTCVDVSKEELVKSRVERIQHLLHPLATVLDDSIGCAIW